MTTSIAALIGAALGASIACAVGRLRRRHTVAPVVHRMVLGAWESPTVKRAPFIDWATQPLFDPATPDPSEETR